MKLKHLLYVIPVVSFVSILVLFSQWTDPSSDQGQPIFLWIIALTIIGLPFPFIFNALRFQHVSFKARKISNEFFEKQGLCFVKSKKTVYFFREECRLDSERELFKMLQQSAKRIHKDLQLTIIEDEETYINLGIKNKMTLYAVVSRGTFNGSGIDILARMLSEQMIFMGLENTHSFNAPSEASPTDMIILMEPDSPIWMAMSFYWNSIKQLKVTDGIFSNKESRSFIERMRDSIISFQQTNANVMQA